MWYKTGMQRNALMQLMRLDKPIGIWLLFFPASWGLLLSPARFEPWLLTVLLIGAVITRAAGCIINDLTDRRFDAQVERTRDRPLASGRISPAQAYTALIVLAVIALLLALLLPGTVLWLALLAVPMIAAYPWMKRFTWWPQLFLGFTFNLGALIGWAATGVPLTITPLILYAACICWTLGYDTIYAVQDKADDARVGIKSTALKLGAQLKPFVGMCYLIMMSLLLLAGVVSYQEPVFYVGLAAAAAHAFWQWHYVQPNDAARAGILFRSNQWLGLILLVGLLLARLV